MTIDEIKAKAQMLLASSRQNQPFVQTYNNGFEDGVNFVLQNLQQTPCTAQLPDDYCEWCKGVCKRKNAMIYDED